MIVQMKSRVMEEKIRYRIFCRSIAEFRIFESYNLDDSSKLNQASDSSDVIVKIPYRHMT